MSPTGKNVRGFRIQILDESKTDSNLNGSPCEEGKELRKVTTTGKRQEVKKQKQNPVPTSLIGQ